MNNENKNTACIFGILLGVVLLLVGFALLVREPLEDTKFGADFYTYSYEATRENAEILRFGLGWLIMGFGGISICYFANQMAVCEQNAKVIELLKAPKNTTISNEEEIEKAQKLKNDGVLSAEEFNKIRDDLLEKSNEEQKNI